MLKLSQLFWLKTALTYPRQWTNVTRWHGWNTNCAQACLHYSYIHKYISRETRSALEYVRTEMYCSHQRSFGGHANSGSYHQDNWNTGITLGTMWCWIISFKVEYKEEGGTKWSTLKNKGLWECQEHPESYLWDLNWHIHYLYHHVIIWPSNRSWEKENV